MEFNAPKYKRTAFTCPHCGAYAQQSWDCYEIVRNDEEKHNYIKDEDDYYTSLQEGWYNENEYSVGKLGLATCKACEQYHIWNNMDMIFPKENNTDIPVSVEDMPKVVKDLYNEAKAVYSISCKASCALLRLAVQHLCIELGEKGKNINDDIGSLVSKGLPVQIQQALDIVRVVGNNAVHPGKMDENDTKEYAFNMFGLLNFIVEDRISKPKQIESLYNGLPTGALKGIENRDVAVTK